MRRGITIRSLREYHREAGKRARERRRRMERAKEAVRIERMMELAAGVK